MSGGRCITFDESCCLVPEVKLWGRFLESEKAELWDRFEAAGGVGTSTTWPVACAVAEVSHSWARPVLAAG